MGADGLLGQGSVADEVARAMLGRRVLLVHGELDDARVGELSASLMMLDATGDDRIVLRITGAGASLEHGLVLMDVLGVVGVPVDVTGAGTILGGAVGLLAAGRHRSLSLHARLHLREPEREVAGRASDIERAVAEQAARRDRFLRALGTATGRPLCEVAAEWDIAPFLDAHDAVTLGYADAVDAEHPRGRTTPS